MKVDLEPAFRRTDYVAAPLIDPPEVLPLPALTEDIEQAKKDLSEYGLCFLANALNPDELSRVQDALDAQAAAERALGKFAPAGALGAQQAISNMVNKGQVFTDLVLRDEVDELAGFLVGKNFLISSLTGGVFHGPTKDAQVLHRDQGQVPPTAGFTAKCNAFWLLDDFSPEAGSTWVVPGSHRWLPQYQFSAPPRDIAQQITAPAGTLFFFDGRIWHGFGANKTGVPRRHIANFLCLPWIRQQENWGVTCLQSVLDKASPKLRRRMGLRSYGTLGIMNGTGLDTTRTTLGSNDVQVPPYIIGEGGKLHKMRRVGDDT